jgi:hypothetical protein
VLVDQGNGSEETVLVFREAGHLRQHLQESSTSVHPPVQHAVPVLAQRQGSHSNEQDPVALPPSELAGEVRRNPAIHEAIQRRDHLIMPRTSPPKVTVRDRYLRCGRVKSGSHHPGGQAACTATQIHEGWVIPSGYHGVDDERPKQTLREVKALWKARRRELGFEDETIFQDWNLAYSHLVTLTCILHNLDLQAH